MAPYQHRRTDFVARAPGMLEIHVNDSSMVDEALERAIRVVEQAAAEHETGILITQIDTGRYIVRAHPAVPVGLVRQQWEPASR